MLCDQKDAEISDLKEKLQNFKVLLSEARNKERELVDELDRARQSNFAPTERPAPVY